MLLATCKNTCPCCKETIGESHQQQLKDMEIWKEWKTWTNENDVLKLYIATMESTTMSLGFEVVSISIYINSGLQS